MSVVNVFRRKRIPRSITILGHKIAIKVVEHLDDEGQALIGAFNAETKTIFLEKGCDPSVLFHESCHAAIYLSGQSEGLSGSKEEALVLALEHALFPLI
jgi:hypothetical protein